MTVDLHGGRLGILAGSGNLPHRIIQQCQQSDQDCFAVYFKGQSEADATETISYKVVRLGQTQKTIDILKKENCTHVVFAGGIKRPSLLDMRPDIRTTRIFARLGLGAVGDDKLLRGIREELESEGFIVLGAHDLVPDLLTPHGVLTKTAPDDRDWADIRSGWQVVETIGGLDIGQACVMQQGITLGVEAVEGTDSLIQRAGVYLRRGGGGVLVKRSKPQQDDKLDIPTIGLQTVDAIKEAGLQGIAVEAGGSQILHQTETIAAANAAKIFIVGVTQADIKNE